MAQPPMGPPPGGPPTGDEPPCWNPAACVPIDSGIVFLIIGGAILGMIMIRRRYLEK
jgi:hypothetical protein